MPKYLAPVICALAIMLTSCDVIRDDINGRTVSMAGAGVVLDEPRTPYDQRSLACLIETATPGAANEVCLPDPPPSPGEPPPPVSLKLERAIGHFDLAVYPGTASGTTESDAAARLRQNQMRQARNEVQGTLLLLSNNRCNAFKLHLREASSNASFALGSLAATFGAVGAIFTNGTSQILSGMAGATSAVNAEYNRDVLSGVTTSVIIPGIDKQRSALLQEIANRRCLGVSSYPLAVALADVSRYHAACSTDVGVATAGQALSQTHTMSLSDVKAAIEAANAISAALRAGTTPGTSGAGTKKGAPAGQTTKPPSDAGSSPPPTKDDPLLGTAVNMPQCPSLNADGTLPDDAVPAFTPDPSKPPSQVPFGKF